MLDKNAKEIKIANKVKPDADGRILLIVSQFEVEELGLCLFGQQIEDPMAFSPLTQENLSEQWTLIEE